MRLRTLALSALLCFLISARPASAALIELGNGMIYDTVQDLTWLQDRNYAMTSGYDADGRMTYAEGQAWTAQLEFGGYDDWRMPVVFEDVLHPLRLPDSEVSRAMAQLGWVWVRTDANYEGWMEYVPGDLSSVGLFMVAEGYWWTYHSDVDYAEGSQSATAWAVRDGLARVPEPSALLLMGLGCFGLWRTRRFQANQ